MFGSYLRALLQLLFILLALGACNRESDASGNVIRINALPPEAREVMQLIDQGGPFPHRRDGIVFQNREGRLPPRQRGCYREYTVPTPGARDRGARRIIADCEGPRYYSDDHYRSFREIHR